MEEPVSPQFELVNVDEVTLAQLVDAAVRNATADEVTPPLGDGSSEWSDARVEWLKAFHRDRRGGYESPLAETTFAVCVGGEIAGSVRLKRTSERSLEVGIWLRRDARGAGIGAAAIAEALREARAGGFEVITAETTVDNVPALGLLRRAGFDVSTRSGGVVEAKIDLGSTTDREYTDAE